MKTFQEIKDEVAKKEGYSSWKLMDDNEGICDLDIENVAKAHTIEVLQSVREKVKVIGTHPTVPDGVGHKIAYVDGWEIKVDLTDIDNAINELKK